MTSARDQQIRALYRAALERRPAERSAFVAELSGGDDELRRSVELMLSQQGATDVGARDSAETDWAADFPAGTRIAHYRIDGVLGRGGMGVVYRATDTKLNRPVAMKFLVGAVADAQAKRRFQQEASTASGLNHPHIVTVYDVGEHDGREYIVSELVDGGTLDDWSVANRRKGWRQSVELITGVADGIGAAHAAGVLHRDIKPGNVLIGSNGYAKLADFGLAKLLDRGAPERKDLLARKSNDTRAGVVIGTIAYMSPEQASGQPLDARSDIFSFGIVLYELLAGRQPFAGANELEQLKSIVHETPAALPYGIPDLLRMAVDKALEKDPADRYQTMRDLVADLRRAARKSSSSQSGARELSDVQVVAAVVNRHRRVVLGTALALVLAIAAGGYFALQGLAPPGAATSSASPAYRITQITRSGDVLAPALSPDGRYVVYSRTQNGLPSGVLVRQIATASDVAVVPLEPGVISGAPTVSPDGEFIDFLRSVTGEPIEVWRVPFLGGTARRIVRNVFTPIGWSPDGRRMAFVRGDAATSTTQLVVADAEGRDERVLATRQAPSYLVSLWLVGTPLARPVWSPDGKVIALFVIDQLESRVLFVDVATGNETLRESGGAAMPEGLAWLGPSALVLSQPGGFFQRTQLYRMSYPEGAVAPLTNDLASYISVDVDAARDSVVTTQRESETSLWVGDGAGGDGREVVTPSALSAPLRTVSWVGERVLYTGAADDRMLVTAVAPETGARQEIVEGLAAQSTADGNTVVFMRRGDGLWKLDRSTGALDHLVDEAMAAWPLITPDDLSVVFISQRGGMQTAWIMPLEGGEPTRIVDDFMGIGGFGVSADGRLVFVSTALNNTRAFVICELPACSNRREVAAPAQFSLPIRWTADGREVAYVDVRGVNLWALSLDGGPPRQLTSFAAPADGRRISDYAWSRDGTRLAIVRTRTADDIVLFRGLSD